MIGVIILVVAVPPRSLVPPRTLTISAFGMMATSSPRPKTRQPNALLPLTRGCLRQLAKSSSPSLAERWSKNSAANTWERSRDTSTVWGTVIGTTTDSDFVAQGAIAWLLIQPVAVQGGIAGGEDFTATTFVQRLNTTGGMAPSSGCASTADVGNQAFVPYTADYVFYERGVSS